MSKTNVKLKFAPSIFAEGMHEAILLSLLRGGPATSKLLNQRLRRSLIRWESRCAMGFDDYFHRCMTQLHIYGLITSDVTEAEFRKQLAEVRARLANLATSQANLTTSAPNLTTSKAKKRQPLYSLTPLGKAYAQWIRSWPKGEEFRRSDAYAKLSAVTLSLFREAYA